ncbi:hypothetical protein IHE44_0009710 [Lamprotornis superbus]|uniref:PQ-loop repeat-containing protein 3 n=1 Tax=Lamprotornis superbus TaxID=245042 RepID=A0A835P2M9_9PASS|nr:hypothetical protein IHE44_0009710 [Lamprotornis superbus]
MSLHTAAAEGVSLCLGLLVFLRYQIYYDYPLETYLEYPIIIAQDAILLYCVMHFSGKAKRALFYTVNLCTLVSAASKLVQLQHLWQTKDSGQASALTWGMGAYTCAKSNFKFQASPMKAQTLYFPVEIKNIVIIIIITINIINIIKGPIPVLKCQIKLDIRPKNYQNINEAVHEQGKRGQSFPSKIPK